MVNRVRARTQVPMRRLRSLILIILAHFDSSVATAQPPAPDPKNAALAAFNTLDFTDKSELGITVFQVGCTRCHGNPAFERAPTPAVLMQFPPERIYQSLTTGTMANIVGYEMSDGAKRAVSDEIRCGSQTHSTRTGSSRNRVNRNGHPFRKKWSF